MESKIYPSPEVTIETASHLPVDAPYATLDELRAKRAARDLRLAPSITAVTGEVPPPRIGVTDTLQSTLGRAAFGIEHLAQDLTTGANHTTGFQDPRQAFAMQQLNDPELAQLQAA